MKVLFELSTNNCDILAGLSLLFTSRAFVIDGCAYEGIPVFVDSTSMRIEYLPTEYCIYVAVVRGRAESRKTWRDVGYILSAFFRFMQSRGFDWRNPTEERLAHYKNHLAQPRKLQSKSRAARLRSPVRVRNRRRRIMKVICDFYQWQVNNGHLPGLPFTSEMAQIKNHGLLAHIQPSKTIARPVLLPRSQDKSEALPHYFTSAECERVRTLLSERDELIFDWALFTGAREFEIAALVIQQIPAASSYQHRRTFPLKLLVDKFSKGGTLFVPAWLLDKTYRYIHLFQRREVAKASRRRGRSISDHIFLGRWGTNLKPDSIYRTFGSVLEDNGLVGTFHDVRHTFAINTLDKLMATERYRGTDGTNALLELTWRLRHERLSTTKRYLRAREFYLTEINSDLWDADVC